MNNARHTPSRSATNRANNATSTQSWSVMYCVNNATSTQSWSVMYCVNNAKPTQSQTGCSSVIKKTRSSYKTHAEEQNNPLEVNYLHHRETDKTACCLLWKPTVPGFYTLMQQDEGPFFRSSQTTLVQTTRFSAWPTFASDTKPVAHVKYPMS